MDFNLASIPPDFTMPYTTPFEHNYMNALYQHGYDLGRGGYRWQKTPPDFQ